MKQKTVPGGSTAARGSETPVGAGRDGDGCVVCYAAGNVVQWPFSMRVIACDQCLANGDFDAWFEKIAAQVAVRLVGSGEESPNDKLSDKSPMKSTDSETTAAGFGSLERSGSHPVSGAPIAEESGSGRSGRSLRRFTGEYAKDGKQTRSAAREAAGNKCIRCGHPNDYASGHVLTTHHFDGNKANDEWWNLMALCQRCHLKVQGKVDPRIPFFLEHSSWMKPYVAGFYAHKYEGRNITREEAMARLDELLAYEFRTGGGGAEQAGDQNATTQSRAGVATDKLTHPRPETPDVR